MMDITEKINVLKKVLLFKYVSDPILQELALTFEEKYVPAGNLIITKGELGNGMYIIAEGKVKVHEEDKFVAELQEGDVFGELAALVPEKRIASISATEDSILFKLD